MDVVANYTPDEIPWYHGGAAGVIKQGQLKEFETGRANYLVNKFGPRGLLLMKFGDNIDDAKKVAMERWEQFWTRQAVQFNQLNEQKKNKRLEYAYPTKELRDHASRLGIRLIAPWTMEDVPASDNKVRELQTKNESLTAQVHELSEMVKSLLTAVKAGNVPEELRTPTEKIILSQPSAPAVPVPETGTTQDEKATPAEGEAAVFVPDMSDHKELIREFQMLKKEEFLAWLSKNSAMVQSPKYPSEVRTLVKQKWARLIGSDFPLPE